MPTAIMTGSTDMVYLWVQLPLSVDIQCAQEFLVELSFSICGLARKSGIKLKLYPVAKRGVPSQRDTPSHRSRGSCLLVR